MTDKDGSDLDRYLDLVSHVKSHYQNSGETFSHGKKTVALTWDERLNCREINLWTYWQGRGSFDPRGNSTVEILLVGKDFGEVPEGSNVIGIAKEANSLPRDRGIPWNPNETGKVSITDERLCELFRAIDDGYDLLNEKYPELFFTNFIPGYRDKGLSGGDMGKCLAAAEKWFEELVGILKPKVVLCLGRDVYEHSLKALGGAPVKPKSYNAVIAEGPARVESSGLGSVAVFPLAHCGGMGTSNRNRASESKDAGMLDLQMEDWRHVGEYLRSLRQESS